jgi:nucleoside-diphosphate-sugar epimerase
MLVHAPSQPGEKINEFRPFEAKWDYPRSKIETEQILRYEHQAIPLVILRIAGVYDDYCHSIPLAHQAQRIYERSFTGHFFPGNLSHGQSFLHLDDLVSLLKMLVEHRQGLPAEMSLLCGEPETVSYGELQKIFGQLIHGERWMTLRIPKWLAKIGAYLKADPFIKPWMIGIADDHYELDISRAKALLAWEPRHSLRGVLPLMVAHLKENPAEWYKQNKLHPPRGLPPAPREAQAGA